MEGEGEGGRETDRQTNRETDRQGDKQGEKQRKIERLTDRQTKTDIQRQTFKDIKVVGGAVQRHILQLYPPRSIPKVS